MRRDFLIRFADVLPGSAPGNFQGISPSTSTQSWLVWESSKCYKKAREVPTAGSWIGFVATQREKVLTALKKGAENHEL